MNQTVENNDHIVQDKWNKVEEIKAMGIEPFGRKYSKLNMVEDIINSEVEFDKDPENYNEIFQTAGRIMAFRPAGKKAVFGHIEDQTGRIQFYIRKDVVGDEAFEVISKIGTGDFIGIKGGVFKTGKGEFTLRAVEFEFLSKNIKPLPDKFHGLTDVETRYRQRYVDLIMNRDVKETFITRTKIVSFIRSFLTKKDFLEVETPIMHPIVGGASAKPFVTHHNALDMELYLRIAPELYLKRLIVGGFDKVFEINRSFRNEGISTRHNPEFTMMELYQAYADFEDIMDLTEEIITNTAKEVLGTTDVVYNGKEIKLEGFKRIHMVDIIKDVTGVDFWPEMSVEAAKELAEANEVHLAPHMDTVGHIINEFFEQKCEDTIVQPTFVMGHPVEISPLAKRTKDDGRFTDRFELFIDAREYGNAFSELNDPADQKSRFMDQVAEATKGNEEANAVVDEDYINALEYGLPPTGGLGIGIDRLVMLLTGAESIRDVLLFPHMRKK
ncbi:lysine--tRNA ligase [Fusobacteria bacterium ZRK30]|nr:lysine--tRNA ligase [Fusobacteria bacterium ZRK30]